MKIGRMSRAAAAAALVVFSGVAAPLSAQLGGRPAEEWAAVLESGRRLSSLDLENVVAKMSLRSGDVVADIGAGTGIFTIPMARAVGSTGEILAVEVDGGFLPMILEKASGEGLSNVRPVLGEFGDPKLPRQDVDVAFFHDVLHHIQDRDGYIRALAPYMDSASRIVVVDYHGEHEANPHRNEPEMLIRLDEVTGWMNGIGFELAETIDLFDEKFFVVYRRRG